MINLFFVDTSVGVAGVYGRPNATTMSYLSPMNYIDDPRRDRQIPIANVPDQTTGTHLISDTDISVLSLPTVTSLFRIIDEVFFSGVLQDETSFKAIVDSDTNAVGYKDGTFVSAELFDVVSDNFTPVLELPMPKMISFTIVYDNIEYPLNIWFHNQYMISNFTDTKISVIIPPMNVQKLYDQQYFPMSAKDLFTAAETAKYFSTCITSAVSEYDHTGIVTFEVKYYSGELSITIPFAILYIGKAPGTIAIQAAIAEFLLNSGVGDKDGWTSRLPSLFVAGSFYVVPFWDNYTQYGSRTLYPSHIKPSVAEAKISTVMYDAAESMSHLTLASTAYTTLVVGILPDPKNTEEYREFVTEHSTYQDYATNNIAFQYMETHTQEFAARLIRALAVAAGETADDFFDTTVMEDRTFVSFTNHGLAYHVMSKETYTNIVG